MESDDDEFDVNNEAQEIMELLKKGDVYNAGNIDPKSLSENRSTPRRTINESLGKMAKGSNHESVPDSPQDLATPGNDFGRSSPKLPWSGRRSFSDTSDSLFASPLASGASMIVDSPSFPNTLRERTASSTRRSSPPQVMATTVYERRETAQNEIEQPRSQRVSRFKASRS